jgi:hypothetical protein
MVVSNIVVLLHLFMMIIKLSIGKDVRLLKLYAD